MSAAKPSEKSVDEKATYERVLRDLARADERIIVMTAENRAAIRNLPPELGARFVDVGICEQTMVGMAAGLALRGRVPVVHALATFLTLRAYEFIRTDAGIAHLPVKLVGGVPGLLSEANGPTHQAIDDVGVMRSIPGMEIFCPADDAELVAGLPAALASPNPCYIRHNARPSTLTHEELVWGRAEVLAEGRDVAILSAGFMVPYAAQACTILRAEGIAARLVNLRTIAPLDEKAIVAAASETPLVVTIEDHLLVGGLYQAVTEVLVRRGVSVPVSPIGFAGRWFRPGRLADVMAHEQLTPAALAARVREARRALDAGDRAGRAAGGPAAAPNPLA
jgi:transketolase